MSEQFTTISIPAPLSVLVSRAAKEAGMSKRAWVSRAIEIALTNHVAILEQGENYLSIHVPDGGEEFAIEFLRFRFKGKWVMISRGWFGVTVYVAVASDHPDIPIPPYHTLVGLYEPSQDDD